MAEPWVNYVAVDTRKKDEMSARREGKKPETEDIDPLAVAEQTVARVARFERHIGSRAGGEGESKLSTIVNSQLAVAVVQALGPAGLQALLSAATGQKLPLGEPGMVVTVTPPAPVQPVASAAQPLSVEDAQGEAAEGASEEPPSTPLFVQWAVSQLERKSPSEAAAWLVSLSQKREEARQLVELATGLTDEQIPAALTQVEQRYPNLAPLTAWLRSRPEWLLATVKEIRQAAQPAAEVSMGL